MKNNYENITIARLFELMEEFPHLTIYRCVYLKDPKEGFFYQMPPAFVKWLTELPDHQCEIPNSWVEFDYDEVVVYIA